MKYIRDHDPWLLGEEIPDCDLFFSHIWLSVFVNQFAKPGGKAYKKILAVYRGYHLWFYFGDRDAAAVGEHLVKKFVSKPAFVPEVNKQIVVWADRLRAFTEKIPTKGLEQLSNAALWKWYHGHDTVHTKYYQWGWIPVAADMFHANFTEHMKGCLKKAGVSQEKLNEYLVILTQPKEKSLIQVEREELLRIALEKNIKKQQERLEAHYRTYFYVNHMWVEEVSCLEDYVQELAKLGTVADIKALVKKQDQQWREAAKKREDLFAKLALPPHVELLLRAFGDFMITKVYRRYAQIYAVYKMEFVLKEIARRHGLSLMQVRFLLPVEVKALLMRGKKPAHLAERTKLCAYYAEKGKDVMMVGDKAQKMAQRAQQIHVDDVGELKGQTGCVGHARGVVKIVIRPADIEKMQQGDVLVSIATDPDIVPAMKKASAIVTEQGGVTSHAAIVSRELHIPCVIGTRSATHVLHDGDVVDVDATQGIVKVIRRA